MMTTCASPRALATRSAPTRPPAPGRFSTTMGWPSRVPMVSARMRDSVSPAPPGGKLTIQRIGRSGQAGGDCAWARPGTMAGAGAARAASRARRGRLMRRPPRRSDGRGSGPSAPRASTAAGRDSIAGTCRPAQHPLVELRFRSSARYRPPWSSLAHGAGNGPARYVPRDGDSDMVQFLYLAVKSCLPAGQCGRRRGRMRWFGRRHANRVPGGIAILSARQPCVAGALRRQGGTGSGAGRQRDTGMRGMGLSLAMIGLLADGRRRAAAAAGARALRPGWCRSRPNPA